MMSQFDNPLVLKERQMRSNNTGIIRFLMQTLGFTAVFMHVFGAALLKWQISHSSLYAYTLALSSTSLSGTEGISAAFYIVACLAIGACAAWVFDMVLSLCEFFLQKLRISLFVKSGCRYSSINLDAVCKQGGEV